MENPLVTVGRNLSGEYVVHKLTMLLTDKKPSNRALALETIVALNGNIDLGLIWHEIETVLSDKEEIVRLAATEMIGNLEKAPKERACIALAKRLGDDSENIRKMAWNALAKFNRDLGIWA
jgi:HEAT repeat protein